MHTKLRLFFLDSHEEGVPLLICWGLSCSCCHYEVCVWFWLVESSGGSLQSYQGNYSDTGWCCVTGRNNTGGWRDMSLQLTSAVSLCLSLWQFIRWQLNFSLWWENIWVCEALNSINASWAQCLFRFPLIFETERSSLIQSLPQSVHTEPWEMFRNWKMRVQELKCVSSFYSFLSNFVSVAISEFTAKLPGE